MGIVKIVVDPRTANKKDRVKIIHFHVFQKQIDLQIASLFVAGLLARAGREDLVSCGLKGLFGMGILNTLVTLWGNHG